MNGKIDIIVEPTVGGEKQDKSSDRVIFSCGSGAGTGCGATIEFIFRAGYSRSVVNECPFCGKLWVFQSLLPKAPIVSKHRKEVPDWAEGINEVSE